MAIVTLDFETAYDTDYSLTKMPTAEYIRDDRFEIIMVGYKVNNQRTRWCAKDLDGMRDELSAIDWQSTTVIAHNAMFDGAILEWVLGFKPKAYFCTMMGARPWVAPFAGSVSLANVAQFFGLGEKLDTVHRVKGMWRYDFNSEELLTYATYCIRDVGLAYEIAKRLVGRYPKSELTLIDHTIKMFTRPRFHLDLPALLTAYCEEMDRKQKIFAQCGLTPFELRSNAAFAAELKNLNVPIPKKLSPTGKSTYAFAKTDSAFTSLLGHHHPRVRRLVQARLAANSNIEETRLKRFIDLAKSGSPLPVPQLYYGAHTGRWSGLDKLNLQNLGRKSPLRRAMIAPPGYRVISADLSQIEARVVACLAGQRDLVRAFARGEDVYCNFATDLYGRKITADDEPERFTGKVAILQLGFQSGGQKFHDTMNSWGASINLEEAHRVVQIYRNRYGMIRQLWNRCEVAIRAMHTGGPYKIGPVTFDREAVPLDSQGSSCIYPVGVARLPNGMKIFYPELRNDGGEFSYKGTGYGSSFKTKKLYGGSLTENIVQALARIIIATAQLRLARAGLRAAMSVHDELVFVVPEEHVEPCKQAIEKALTATVPWMPDLPVACEIKDGDNYGECK